MADSTTAPEGSGVSIPAGAAASVKNILGGLQNALGSDMVQGTASTVGKYADIASFLTGFVTDNTNTQSTVKEVADLAKGAESFSKFLKGQQTVPKTIGDMVEAVQEYKVFKEDVENGDGPMWAAIKAKFVSKIEGWLAEKVAGMAAGALGAKDWTLPQFNAALKNERGGDETLQASAAPSSGLPKQAGAGMAKAT